MKLSIKRGVAIALAILVVVLVLMVHQQHTHFNQNVTVNGVRVGGMNVKQAFTKVKAAKRPNRVYINGHLVYSGTPSPSGISDNQEQQLRQLQKRQRTFFPSKKKQALILTPAHNPVDRQNELANAVNTALQQMNQGRKRPVDAYALLKNNRVTIIPAKAGDMYDQEDVMHQFNRQAAQGTIKITAHHMHPLPASSPTVKHEKAQLQKLHKRTVTYQVAGKSYHLTGADIITSATYQHGKYQLDLHKLNTSIDRINHRQATLGRSFKFKTPTGKWITTSNKGTYGWKISKTKAQQSFTNALTKNHQQVDARQDIYGKGYYTGGTGYGKKANDGLGKTYAVISIADQHAWFYRNGKQVFDADVVTGSNKPGDRTPRGVWYIMYQQSPSVLKGSNDDGSQYASKVKYWSQFTNSGCGFHDAPWRTDWSKTAYLKTNSVTKGGSHGCANMKPADAPKAYQVLSVHEPVIVY